MSAYATQVSQANSHQITQAGGADQRQINSIQTRLNQEEQQLAAAFKSGQDPHSAAG